MFFTDYDFDDELEDLKLEARAERDHKRRIAAHPDYRDPDYPECEPEDEDSDE